MSIVYATATKTARLTSVVVRYKLQVTATAVGGTVHIQEVEMDVV